eukprot:6184790-Pleurochrysis_carterae.AAC.1
MAYISIYLTCMHAAALTSPRFDARVFRLYVRRRVSLRLQPSKYSVPRNCEYRLLATDASSNRISA